MREYELLLTEDFDDYERLEIKRNLHTLLSTRAGAQPADRDFGISWECMDEVPDVSESLFVLEVSKKTEKYEPRVIVSDVVFLCKDGAVIPTVYFVRKGAG